MREQLIRAVRNAAGSQIWGAAVPLVRQGAVQGMTDDGDEVHFLVKTKGKALPHEVYLWPQDGEWGCDCGRPGKACVHVAAATIAWNSEEKPKPLGKKKPAVEHKVSLRYVFTTEKHSLRVQREVVYATGRVEPLDKPLAQTHLIVDRADAQAETLLVMHPRGLPTPEHLRRLLAILHKNTNAILDGEPIKIDGNPMLFRVRVADDGEGFKIGMVRPKGVDKLYRGAALSKGVLRPTSHGDLTPEQRRMLVKGVHFRENEVGTLVSETIPKLRERAPVDIATDRLPDSDTLKPVVLVKLEERSGGLRVDPTVVYGDPPVAKVLSGGALQRIGADVVAARDLAAERIVARTFQALTGVTPGLPRILPPAEAAAFLTEKLPKHTGPVKGKIDPHRFAVHAISLAPKLDIRQTAQKTETSSGDGGGWFFDVQFGGERRADPMAVLDAWRGGRSLVPLLDGGYAPLPANWLQLHGPLLEELLEARDVTGKVSRNATAALVELLEDTDADVPQDLRKLRSFLESDEDLEPAEPPKGLVAELRPYQGVGYQWLRFLRDMQLGGVLADDMGLGKTLQALTVLLATPGKHLVVAPTSVLRNWERETQRFTPELSVNLFHGPNRALDDSAVTLTSYALLRLDLDRLQEVDWCYCVLDEAQCIKNPRSQTARAAFALQSEYRLALTGTPVENRLEELWSLFRFLMPGLLGSVTSFRDGFVKPIENGDKKSRERLRNRIRPYVLRRMKSQVAADLPPLTEIVERCIMSDAQRKVYDTVRLAAREDVQRALAENGRASAMQVLEALLRMRQACCDPALLPGTVGEGADSAKLARLEELLIDLVPDGHKLLIFSQWTSLLDQVEPRLNDLDIGFVRLDGTTKNRQAVIDRFQDEDGPPVFLLSLKAGGTGLNLTAADYVLHLDPWWNPAVERQATDRAHRIGQNKPVVSVRLIAEGTVEERILELQDRKRDLADAALGTNGGLLTALTADELRSLFDHD